MSPKRHGPALATHSIRIAPPASIIYSVREAPVVQWTEPARPKGKMGVRFFPGALRPSYHTGGLSTSAAFLFPRKEYGKKSCFPPFNPTPGGPSPEKRNNICRWSWHVPTLLQRTRGSPSTDQIPPLSFQRCAPPRSALRRSSHCGVARFPLSNRGKGKQPPRIAGGASPVV